MQRLQNSNLLTKFMFHLSLVLAAAAVTGPALHAQTAATAPAYDVAVIKPNKTGAQGIDITFSDHGTFNATNATVRQLIEVAFHMRHDLVFNTPGWAQDEHFDIEAKQLDADKKSDANLTPEQRTAMLQQLLIDRFQLKSHKETRVMALYELVVNKGGSKMTPVEYSGKGSSGLRGGRNGDVTGLACEMELLAHFLSNVTSSVVNDKTGLTGRYNFHLKWSPDGTAVTDDAPSIFTAVQEQLGLKLQPTKGPVEVLVVDSVQQPSEN